MRRRREWDRRYWQVAVGAAFMLLPALLLSPTAGFAQEYKEYHCVPDIQYECAGGRCEKIADGFRHVESFVYNAKTGMLSACLWTNCYAAAAAVFNDMASEAAGTITAIGKLTPTAHPGNEPIIVSLTVDTRDAGEPGHRDATDKNTVGFTVVWGYGSKGLTLDMGRCAIKELP
ncbi:MAG: hypothetical protein L0H15_02985 [Nitrosospira sp.]|nr:hypothetical protein [Nitrosospira sp.]